MPVSRILRGGRTRDISFDLFKVFQSWWCLLHLPLQTPVSSCKTAHTNGYYGAWSGWALFRLYASPNNIVLTVWSKTHVCLRDCKTAAAGLVFLTCYFWLSLSWTPAPRTTPSPDSPVLSVLLQSEHSSVGSWLLWPWWLWRLWANHLADSLKHWSLSSVFSWRGHVMDFCTRMSQSLCSSQPQWVAHDACVSYYLRVLIYSFDWDLFCHVSSLGFSPLVPVNT